MFQSAISKRSIMLLTAIAALAVILSIISYQYSTATSNDIVDIASQEIRSNARIAAHDLSHIVTNRLQTITVLLQTLTDSPALQNNQYQIAQRIINDRQNYTSDLTDFYMWLDQNDNVPRLYISYPILSKAGSRYNANNSVNNETNPNNFKGIVVAAVNDTTTANILKSQLLPQFSSTVSLLDSNGIILHTNNRSLVGKNIFGTKLQSIISSLTTNSSKNLLNNLLLASLQQTNNGGVQDINMQSRTTTIAYEPITIQGKHF